MALAKRLLRLTQKIITEPMEAMRFLGGVPDSMRGLAFKPAQGPERASTRDASSNPLRQFFDSRTTGRGIWKWEHYFDVYHRHFQRFVGKEIRLLEVGIYSGGSLDMWRNYFGESCRIYGVDIEPACQAYASEHVEIFIGDQADRDFWRSLKKAVPAIDILIDDGGHRPEQQIATFEEMLPHISPGGVYVCEDIHTVHQGFGEYIHGFARNLNDITPRPIVTNNMQKHVSSVHFYPYVAVVEKNSYPVDELKSTKHGTEWQPFL